MSRRSIILGLVPATFFIVLTSPGCGRDGSSAEGSVSPTAPDIVIAGEGSTFVMPLMQAWISGYQSAHPKKLINYVSFRQRCVVQLLWEPVKTSSRHRKPADSITAFTLVKKERPDASGGNLKTTLKTIGLSFAFG